MTDDDKDNITFMDLACLFKIAPDTTLERFGTIINASIFDAANISGGLKQKGLIDFTAYYPGPNSIAVTDAGKALKADADAKSTAVLDELDEEVLKQLSGGTRMPTELQSTLNLRSKDLALRIYKLGRQGLLSYELKNGNVELMLTEQGFFKAKAAHAAMGAAGAVPQKAGAQPGGHASAKDPANAAIAAKAGAGKGRVLILAVVCVVAVAAVALIFLYGSGKLNMAI
jgi:hypothetical protein